MNDRTENNVSMLILSDLHAVTEESKQSDSYLTFIDKKSEFADELILYLKSIPEKIDVLICPGDIANKADEEAFELGWAFLKSIQSTLNIPLLLCVPGNHDHKSRDTEGLSPTHFLQYLKPYFPVDNKAQRDHFWAWNWLATDSNKHFNSILLNTSAYHGYKESNNDQGQVAPEACIDIGKHVKNFKDKPFNILLCHHAPYKMEHASPNGNDNQEIQGAQNLIHILEKNNHNPWLVIHGHKHFGDLRYAISKKNVPTTLFSAGSLSAKSHSDNPNQFHILNIHLEESELSGKVVGTSHNYEYKFGTGWQPSNTPSLPAVSGFGSNTQIPALARKLASSIERDAAKFLERPELREINSEILYCTQEDINYLKYCLDKLNISIELTNNEILEAGIKNEHP